MIRSATFTEFKRNYGLIEWNLSGRYMVHYEWIPEMQVYALVSDRDNNLMFPPHFSNLKELYKNHRILVDEPNLFEDLD